MAGTTASQPRKNAAKKSVAKTPVTKPKRKYEKRIKTLPPSLLPLSHSDYRTFAAQKLLNDSSEVKPHFVIPSNEQSVFYITLDGVPGALVSVFFLERIVYSRPIPNVPKFQGLPPLPGSEDGEAFEGSIAQENVNVEIFPGCEFYPMSPDRHADKRELATLWCSEADVRESLAHLK